MISFEIFLYFNFSHISLKSLIIFLKTVFKIVKQKTNHVICDSFEYISNSSCLNALIN